MRGQARGVTIFHLFHRRVLEPTRSLGWATSKRGKLEQLQPLCAAVSATVSEIIGDLALLPTIPTSSRWTPIPVAARCRPQITGTMAHPLPAAVDPSTGRCEG